MDIPLMQYATALPADCPLSHNARCALVWLAASKFDSNAECAPAIGTIAQRAALSYDSISRGIAELERAGIVKRAARLVGGRQVANRYEVKLGGAHSDTATAHSGTKETSRVLKKVCVQNAPARVRAREGAAACAAAHTHTIFNDDVFSDGGAAGDHKPLTVESLAADCAVPLDFTIATLAEWKKSEWTTTQGKPITRRTIKAHLRAWWKNEKERGQYEKPKAKPRKFTAKDWLLCAERCAHCAGSGCRKGITTPPEKDANPYPPEECKGFTAIAAEGKRQK